MTAKISAVPAAPAAEPQRQTLAVRRAYPLLLLALCLALFAWENRHVQPQLDDAYISYRYARNLVAGRGLVYNAGEYVEGITNLLWTLLVAAGIALRFGGREVGHALGVFSAVAALAATFAYASARLRPERRWLAVLAPGLLLCSPEFVLWSTSGMELPLFVAAGTAALAAHAFSRRGLATVLLVVATLTRPEGVLLAAILYGVDARRYWPPTWRRGWQPAIYALALLLLTGFRLVYYGSPVPNTFYAKVGGVPLAQGPRYAAQFFWDGAVLLAIPAAFAALREPRWRAGALWVAAMSVYVAAIGGDPFTHYRLVPVLPTLAALGVRGALLAWDEGHALRGLLPVCVAAAGAELWLGTLAGVAVVAVGGSAAALRTAAGGRRRALFAGALALAALIALDPLERLTGSGDVLVQLSGTRRARRLADARQRFQFTETVGLVQARELRSRGDPRALVAASAIGSLGWFSQLPILDIFGLVDATVAHSRSQPPPDAWLVPGHQRSAADYVLARRPEYILIPRPGSWMRFPANVDLWEHPKLASDYEWDEELKGYRRRR